MMPEHQSNAPLGEQTLPTRAERKATNWIALLRTPDGTEIPCNVKDVSSSGARLGVPAHYELPPTFMLKVVGRDFVCRVRLAWRKGDYVGVQIEQIGKLAGAPTGLVKASPQTSQPSTAPYSAIGSRRSRISTF